MSDKTGKEFCIHTYHATMGVRTDYKGTFTEAQKFAYNQFENMNGVYKVKVWKGEPDKPNNPNAENLALELV